MFFLSHSHRFQCVGYTAVFFAFNLTYGISITNSIRWCLHNPKKTCWKQKKQRIAIFKNGISDGAKTVICLYTTYISPIRTPLYFPANLPNVSYRLQFPSTKLELKTHQNCMFAGSLSFAQCSIIDILCESTAITLRMLSDRFRKRMKKRMLFKPYNEFHQIQKITCVNAAIEI